MKYRKIAIHQSHRSHNPIKRIESNRNENIHSRVNRDMQQNQSDECNETDDMLNNKNLIPNIPYWRKTRDNDPYQHKVSRHPILDHGHHLNLRFNNMINRPFAPEKSKIDSH